MSGWTIEGDYRADGAVCVRQAFSPEHVALALEAIEENLADLSPLDAGAAMDHPLFPMLWSRPVDIVATP